MAFVVHASLRLPGDAPARPACLARPPPSVPVTVASLIPSSPAELLRRYSSGSESGKTAVLERPVETAPPRAVDPERKFRVILYGDLKHSRTFVSKTLANIVRELSPDQARRIAEAALKTGKATVGTWVYEIAEMYADLLRNNGLRSDIVEE